MAKIVLGVIVVLLLLCVCSCETRIKPARALIIDKGMSYSKGIGTYNYVKMSDANGKIYIMTDVNLDQYVVGQSVDFFVEHD